MRRIRANLILLPLLLAACGQTNAEFDMRLREMAGANERDLVGSMGRIPDNSYQLDEETKILQWRWDTSYIRPGMPPMYIGAAIGARCTSAGSRPPSCPRVAS